MLFLRTAIAGILALWIPTVCMAGDDETLTIGDKAPDIDIAHWLKGDQVKGFEDGKVYVMEFWATWCGPCRASMPHISKLQEKYKDYDVTVIGVSDEDLQTVVKFLCKTDKEETLWNDKIQYTLATDPDRSVYKSYMTAAAQRGIPTTFIVGKDQRIEWIGHPMGMDQPLDDVVRDNWDREVAKVKFEEEVAQAREMMKYQRRIKEATDESDWDGAIKAVNELTEINERYFQFKASLFRSMLIKCEDTSRTYGFGREIAKSHWDDAMFLNQIAWFTVDEKEVKKRDLKFALETALRANELTEGKDGAILDTVARVYFEQGDLETAVEYQRKAVESVQEGPMADELKQALEKYEKLAESRR